MRDVAVALREVVVATDAYRQSVARVLGLGIGETAVLGQLLHHGPQRPSALARRVGVTPASMTAQLDRIELAGLTARQNDPRDRRSVLVALTPSGREVITDLFGMFAADVTAGIADAHPDHVDELTRMLRSVASALHARTTDPDAIRRSLADAPPAPA